VDPVAPLPVVIEPLPGLPDILPDAVEPAPVIGLTLPGAVAAPLPPGPLATLPEPADIPEPAAPADAPPAACAKTCGEKAPIVSTTPTPVAILNKRPLSFTKMPP